MALSGSFDYVVTAQQVITDALENIQVLEAGESIDSDDQTTALRTLNLLIKQLSTSGDQSPGVKCWLRKEVFLFPEKGQSQYTLGPTSQSSDHMTQAYVRDTVATAVSSGTTLVVADGSDTADGDVIGLVLDSGAVHWTTIASGGGTATLTLTDAVPSLASVGNYVYSYTTPIAFAPTEIVHVALRDPQSNDTPVPVIREINSYNDLPSKTVQAQPGYAWYERRLLTGQLQFDTAFPAFYHVVRLYTLAPADDIDAVTDSLAFPAENQAQISWELALRLAPKFGKAWTQEMDKSYNLAVSVARYNNLPGAQGGYNADDSGMSESL